MFKQLEVHEINTHSLALEWRGDDPGLKPWLLCAHQVGFGRIVGLPIVLLLIHFTPES